MNATIRAVMLAGLLGMTAAAVAEERQTTGPAAEEQQKTESQSAAAQPPMPTMKELLAAGYEIKTATFIPHDAVKRGGSTTDVDAVVILLEKGAAVASCYTDFASYTGGGFYTLGCTEMK
jgi:hypothetical protein